MTTKDACAGAPPRAQQAEKATEDAHALGKPISGLDLLNILNGPGVSPKEGNANIAAFQKCNGQRAKEIPGLPQITITPG